MAYSYDGERVCVLPRLSLCELIAACGLVRTVCSRSTDVMLVVNRDHVSPVRAMFSDVPNMRFTCVDSWEAVYAGDRPGERSFLDAMEAKGYKIIPLPSVRDLDVYGLLGLDRALMHTAFAVHRSSSVEEALLRRVVAETGATFSVKHDAPDRRIKPGTTGPYPVVDVNDPRFKTANIFDWLMVMDRAIELHAIDSCFVMLADVLSLRPRKYVHAYTSPKMPRHYRDAIVVW